ncbi:MULTISPECIES: DUF3597 domain-containing protein [unclassified Achromobacter]|uniref:DUF3597 domain-containing protein n=1 Tax=unclassified Achromobacter TaxID=2626865 RepID=UPI000B51A3C8|nr:MULTISPECIES: DUF3597 domain-containing protein [unclassified Achromobacter]OWT69049.1 hypothetical protein CEY05_27775 [Achromobacter sp. HZ34]OWT70454.1 hypothetical protein CEY04_26605 [Achromobacter sp. HZ28]
MGIFSTILAKIFPSDHPAAASGAAGAAAGSAPGAAPASGGAPAAASGAAPAAANLPPVDVEAILSAKQASSGQPLNWRTSIVDLMKLLGLDSSLAARKTLAGELGYTGSTDDSAAMNIWLHKEVMTKLAANGGKVPDDLKN